MLTKGKDTKKYSKDAKPLFILKQTIAVSCNCKTCTRVSFVPTQDKIKPGKNFLFLRHSLTATAILLSVLIALCYWVLAHQEFDLLAPGKRGMLKPYKEKVLWQHGLVAEGSGQLLVLFRGLLEGRF